LGGLWWRSGMRWGAVSAGGFVAPYREKDLEFLLGLGPMGLMRTVGLNWLPSKIGQLTDVSH